MYYCKVVHVLLYIPMKTEEGVHGPPGPPPESAPVHIQCHTQVQLHYLSVLTTPMTSRKPTLSAWRKEEEGWRQEWKEGQTGEGEGETMF